MVWDESTDEESHDRQPETRHCDMAHGDASVRDGPARKPADDHGPEAENRPRLVAMERSMRNTGLPVFMPRTWSSSG